jgi:hypothetical protein
MRIRRQKRFRMMAIADGVIDKRRAIEEIEQRTAIGQALVEIEHIAIEMMKAEARRRRARRTRKRRR